MGRSLVCVCGGGNVGGGGDGDVGGGAWRPSSALQWCRRCRRCVGFVAWLQGRAPFGKRWCALGARRRKWRPRGAVDAYGFFGKSCGVGMARVGSRMVYRGVVMEVTQGVRDKWRGARSP